MDKVQHLSAAAHARLTDEYRELSTVIRLDLARKIQTARELGDLSENGDYHAAKDEQGKTEARIRQLEVILEHAVITDGVVVGDTVVAGAIVGLRYEGDTDVEKYLIGSIEEKLNGIEIMSPASPLGLVLMGRKLGEIVEYAAPRGILKVEIVSLDS